MTLDISLGYFCFKVKVYCEEEESFAHCLSSKVSRKDSAIYLPEKIDNDIVVKCYPLQNESNMTEVFADALK